MIVTVLVGRLLRERPVFLLCIASAMLIAGAAVLDRALANAPAPRFDSPPHLATLKANLQPAVATTTPLAVAPQVFEQLSPQQAFAINEGIPVSALPNPPAKPFTLGDVSALDRARAQNCLAMAIYYEAASQGPDGEAAVAQVVLNRVRNPLFPKSVCGVVFEGSELPTGCQFTFTCDGSLTRAPSAAGWKDASYVANRALSGYVEKSVGEATHYHTVWVVPYWQPTVIKVAQIGAHVFYRWKGGLGLPGAFAGLYAGAEFAPPLPKYANATLAAFTTTVSEAPLPAPVSAADAPSSPPPAAPIAASIVVADQTLQPAPNLPTAIEAPRQSYFGHGDSGVQRLAVPR